MPLQLVNQNKAPLFAAKEITLRQIQELYDNYKKHTGKRVKLGDAYEDFNPAKHTRYGWFSLSEVLAFLKSNGADPLAPGFDPSPFGIRMYFGQHDINGTYKPTPSDPGTDPREYDKKDTIIFVLTKDDEDQLDEEKNFVSLAPFAGQVGMDNSKLCPPECSSTGSPIKP